MKSSFETAKKGFFVVSSLDTMSKDIGDEFLHRSILLLQVLDLLLGGTRGIWISEGLP